MFVVELNICYKAVGTFVEVRRTMLGGLVLGEAVEERCSARYSNRYSNIQNF